MKDGKKLALVLGGGGMKGLAHIGAIRVLHRFGLAPDEYIGVSSGALIAALAAGGMDPDELEATGLSIRRRDILDYNWLGLLWRGGRARSLYRGKALHDFVRRVLPVDSFEKLPHPLFITSVDLNHAQEVIWGMPGFTEVPIHDCVVASCAIPGIYPPKKINRFHFVDGSLVDSLPVKVAVYGKADLIVAVYLEPAENPECPVENVGVGAIVQQSQSILSRTLARHNLHYFDKAPIVLVRPRVGQFDFFDFHNAADIVREGERATEETLRSHPLTAPYFRSAPTPAPR